MTRRPAVQPQRLDRSEMARKATGSRRKIRKRGANSAEIVPGSTNAAPRSVDSGQVRDGERGTDASTEGRRRRGTEACTEADQKAGNRMKAQLDTYLTGTLAGAGSFRCNDCGFAVALNALDEIPQCPNCGNARFARASMFDTSGSDHAPPLEEEDDDNQWLEAVREELDEGVYLAFRDESRVSVMPVTSEWTKIGRSLTADVRFDDPTVSRRHAIIVLQGDDVRVLDDRSLNGVFLNGERVEWGELEDGDELIIGRYRLYFLRSSAAGGRAHVGAGEAAA
jgi:rubrerythrin